MPMRTNAPETFEKYSFAETTRHSFRDNPVERLLPLTTVGRCPPLYAVKFFGGISRGLAFYPMSTPSFLNSRKLMKKSDFDRHLERATEQLRAEPAVDGLHDFERRVWAEIALHDERWPSRIARFFREGLPTLPVPAVAGSVATALVVGVLTALVQAKSYGETLSDSMEARYVSTIHPVLRSESEDHRHRSPNR